jgi:methionyl aminopeptidase
MLTKSPEEIEIMRKAAQLVTRTLNMVGENITPGMTTAELDRLVEQFILDHGAKPGFKGFHGYPASACISIDDEVVHGIPGDRVMREGQIVSVDVGTIVEGFYGDSARTFALGEIPAEVQRLLDVTQEALEAGIEQARPGNRVGHISHAVQQVAEKEGGFGVVRQLVGHGIGRTMHEDPQIPNFGSINEGPKLRAGLVICIEPMINMGTHQVKTLPDGWTVVTADGRPSAHFEHQVAITDDGPDVLSKL